MAPPLQSPIHITNGAPGDDSDECAEMWARRGAPYGRHGVHVITVYHINMRR